jgi:hypothetical protein
MKKKLIIICHNKTFGESLAFSLNVLFGFDEYLLDNISSNLYNQLMAINITDSIILIEDSIPALNYPSLIGDIKTFNPAALFLLGSCIEETIALSKIKKLGCDATLNKSIGLKGMVNALVSWKENEDPIGIELEPLKRLSLDDQEFLKDVYYLTPRVVKEKYGVSQQRVWQRKEMLFGKLHLNDNDLGGGFRALGHLYKI